MLVIHLASAFPTNVFFRWVFWSPVVLNTLRQSRQALVVWRADTARVPHVFLADGGHAENTSILPLLRRQCTRILAVDAGVRNTRRMRAFRQLVKLAHEQLGCSFCPANSDADPRKPDLEKALNLFEKPRTRYIEAGQDACDGPIELQERWQRCMAYLHKVSNEQPGMYDDGGDEDLRGSLRPSSNFSMRRQGQVNRQASTETTEEELEAVTWLSQCDISRGLGSIIFCVEKDMADRHVYVYFQS